MYEDSYLELPQAKILAVRGPLSAKGLRGEGNISLGDPGLLASLLVSPQAVKYDLGVIPHWSDQDLVKRFAYGHLISPRNGAMFVISEIAKCRRIVTSSLHGTIVADSFGIPRQVELPPRLLQEKEGGSFKYNDYASLYGPPSKYTNFGKMAEVPRERVDQVKRELEAAFKVLIEGLE